MHPYLTGRSPSNLFWWWRNNVAICWIRVFAHSDWHWKTSSIPCDDSWQAITCQLRPSAPTKSSVAQSYFTSLKPIEATEDPLLKRSTRTRASHPLVHKRNRKMLSSSMVSGKKCSHTLIIVVWYKPYSGKSRAWWQLGLLNMENIWACDQDLHLFISVCHIVYL